MEIKKTFEISAPPEVVWDAFADVRLVAECLPGASIVEQLGANRYKGRFSVKLGPLAAAFEGEVTIERRPAERTGVVAGKGADARSSSRASGQMSYRVEAAGPGRTRVDVTCEINLAGALAQFGKAGVIREIANRITAEFVRNFEARLAARQPAQAALEPSTAATPTPPETRSAPPQSLDAGKLVWTILWDRLVSLVRAMFGRRAQQ
jgi:carbon monoxide dehydrogenase subunit G